MIILHELNQLEMGGAERVVHGIAKHDTKNKHVVYSYKDGPMRQEFEAVGVEVLIEDPKVTHDCNSDIIHIHTGGDLSKMASAIKGRLPIIETVHCPVVSAVRDKWVVRRIGVSNRVSAKNRNCQTIYNGVDIDRLEETSKPFVVDGNEFSFRKYHKIPDNAFVIGRLGRIGWDKNVEEFLLACWKFQKMHPNSERPIYVVIAGGEAMSCKGYLAKVKVMAASLPIKNVFFVGETKDVGWVYEALDVFLYPSDNEAFGLVWLEAMAAGVPVVTWESDISKELLLGGAYLAPQRTVDALMQGVDLLYRKPELVQEFAVYGSELARGYFSSEKMSEEYQKIYEEVYENAYSVPKLVSGENA